MNKLNLRRFGITTGLAAMMIAASCLTSVAFATNDQNNGESNEKKVNQDKKPKKHEIASKLDDTKRSTCQKREKKIKKIMQSMQLRSERQLDVFNKIAERTKSFYEAKQRSVASYNDLVAAVDEKKSAAEIALQAGSSIIADFSCSEDDPLVLKDLFKTQLQEQIAALKAYKTTVNDLIVAVKSASS